MASGDVAPAAPTEPAAPAPEPAAPAPNRRSGLVHDAAITIATRFGLAVLIFATDVILANALGPAAKGRFALILLYSQLVATVIGFGMDQAIAVVTGRGPDEGRRAFANAILWTAVVGGGTVIASLWLYGIPATGAPSGPLVALFPNLSGGQFTFAAFAIPAELFFNLGLFALLGRRRVAAYSWIRLLRRLTLLALLLGTALVANLDLATAIVLNLVSLGLTIAAIVWAAARERIVGIVPSIELLGEEIRYGGKSVVGTIAERLQFRADSFIVNAISGVRATGIYSVTSGLAETLWYVPNALGVVMFSRAVDPKADAGRTAATLTRTTLALSVLLAVPTAAFGPRLVRLVYGSAFTDAGVALRLIIPGVVAYSVVAVLSRYLSGGGRPGTGTVILLFGLAANVIANLLLVPRFGILGAAVASSISYGLTAVVMLVVFVRLSGRGVGETLIVRRSDVVAAMSVARALVRRLTGHRRPAAEDDVSVAPEAADIILGEHAPGEEP